MKNTAQKIIAGLATILFAQAAFAEEAANTAAAAGGGLHTNGLVAIGAGVAIGAAVLGGAIGQSIAAASALEGIARNPAAQGKIFIPMIISMALIESLVLFAFVIAFLLKGLV